VSSGAPLSTAMSRTRQSVLVAIVVVLACSLPSGAEEGVQHKPTDASSEARKTLKPPTAKQGQSALPLSPKQLPSSPPKVTYLGGQLTVIAENSSLAEVLSAVSTQTGVVIDLPPGSGSERVAGRMGPGPARDVLAALLNGSRFDYVMTGSPSNPAVVEHIILIPRGDESESTSPVGNHANAINQAGQQLSRQNVTETELAQQQPSQQDVTEAETTSEGTGYAGFVNWEQPARVWTSEGVPSNGQTQASGQQRTGWQMPQTSPQEPGSSPQPVSTPQQPPANSPPPTPQGPPNPPLPPI